MALTRMFFGPSAAVVGWAGTDAELDVPPLEMKVGADVHAVRVVNSTAPLRIAILFRTGLFQPPAHIVAQLGDRPPGSVRAALQA